MTTLNRLCVIAVLLAGTAAFGQDTTYHRPIDPGDGVSPFSGGDVDWNEVSGVIWYGKTSQWILINQNNRFQMLDSDGSLSTPSQTNVSQCLAVPGQGEGLTTIAKAGDTNDDIVCVQNENDPGMCCADGDDIVDGGDVTWLFEVMFGNCSDDATIDCNDDADCVGTCDSFPAVGNHEGLAFAPHASSGGRYDGYFYTATQSSEIIFRYELHTTGNYFTLIDSQTPPAGCPILEVAAMEYDYDSERLYVYSDSSDDRYCVLDKDLTTHYATYDAPPDRCSLDISELCSETCTSGICKVWGLEAMAFGGGQIMFGDDQTGATSDAYNGMFLYPDSFTGEFYVDNACGNDGNGLSNSCASGAGLDGAWNSLANIDCDALEAGDIVNINGGTYYERWIPAAACSGATGDPLIIQNMATEAVIIDGTTDVSGQTWVSRGNNDWECTAGCGGTTWIAWYDNGGGEVEVVYDPNDPATNACGTSAALPTANTLYWNNTLGTACVDLGGVNPTTTTYTRFPTAPEGVTFVNNTVDHVTLRVNSGGGSFSVQRFDQYGVSMTTDSDGITIDGLDIGYAEDRCINDTSIGGNPLAVTRNFINNTVHHCGQEGIRVDNSTGVSTVSNNTVHTVQTTDLWPICTGSTPNDCQSVGLGDTATGIRIAKSSNVTVSGNTIYNIGGGKDQLLKSNGIDLESDAVKTPLLGCTDCIVENNIIYDIDHGGTPTFGGRGILFGSSFDGSYDGTIVRNNRISDVDTCLMLGNGATYPADTIEFYNNTCLEPLSHGFTVSGTFTLPTVKLRNNIFTAPTTTPTYLVDISGTVGGFVIANYDFNSYYCPSCTSNNIIDWKGTVYKGDESCTSDCVTDLDVDNTYGDPTIVTSGTPPSMQITGAGSALDQGVGLGALVPLDYLGTARPVGSAYDIGAHELLSTTSSISGVTLLGVSVN